jgi:hypothetical protein
MSAPGVIDSPVALVHRLVNSTSADVFCCCTDGTCDLDSIIGHSFNSLTKVRFLDVSSIFPTASSLHFTTNFQKFPIFKYEINN